MHEKLLNTVDGPAMTAPADPYNVEATKVYDKYKEDCLNAKYIIIASMSYELQRQHQDMDPTTIIEHLKKMYDGQSRTAMSSMPAKDQVGSQVLKMIYLIEQLEKLECKIGNELSQDLILQPLPESFSQFIVNFNMNKMNCDLHEMLNMLIDYQNQSVSEYKTRTIMVVRNSSKRKGKKNIKPKNNLLQGVV
ncbi:hypothetical protein Lal_00018703 [Lupinus albus]|nr:hypothetical protein Lal_00018703 [Lupinus albus]